MPGTILSCSPTLHTKFLSVKPSLMALVNLASQIALGTLCPHAWRLEGHHVHSTLKWVLGIETLALLFVRQAL